MQLVKHHNDINKLKLGTLNEKELNVFISLLFKLKDKSKDKLLLDFKELLELTEANNRSHKRLVGQIVAMNKKLLAIDYMIEEDGIITQFNIFNTFKTDTKNKTLEVSINENFEFMLNGLTKNFTTYSLKEYVTLKSTYSKMAYKLLKQFRVKGERYITLEEFKEILEVPKKYSMADFNKRVLNPILKELRDIFSNLELIKLTKKNEIVGRGKKIHTLKFKWDVSSKLSLQDNIKNRDDKIQAKAKERANTKHLEVEEKVNNKKVSSDLEGEDLKFFNEVKELTLKELEKRRKSMEPNVFLMIKSKIKSTTEFEELTNIVAEYKLNEE